MSEFVGELALHQLVLQLAQLLVVPGDRIEGFKHFRLELGLHGRQRHGVLELVLVEIVLVAAFGVFLAGFPLVVVGGRRRSRLGGTVYAIDDAGRLRSRDDGGFRLAGERAGIGRFEIDNVAKQNLAFVQLVPPDDDRLEGQRAFAEPGDHRLAAGLDPLGDGDFAFAGEQLDRAHLAQIHADRIVGPVRGQLRALVLLGDGLHRAHSAFFVVSVVQRCRVGFLDLLGVDDVDAHIGQHRHDVFDLLRRHFA